MRKMKPRFAPLDRVPPAGSLTFATLRSRAAMLPDSLNGAFSFSIPISGTLTHTCLNILKGNVSGFMPMEESLVLKVGILTFKIPLGFNTTQRPVHYEAKFLLYVPFLLR
jgi:hypothetical protein